MHSINASLRRLSLLIALLGMPLVMTGCADLKTGKAAYDAGDYQTAARHYHELAEFGLAEAKTAYAQLLLKGQGVPVDQAKARQLLEEAYVQQHYDRAGLPLAKLYAKGTGGPVQKDKAIQIYERALANGNTRVTYDLAKLYGKNPDRAAKTAHLYKEAFSSGDKRVAFELARNAEQQGRFSEAADLYREALKDNPRAAKNLGLLYESKIKPADNVKALAWYYYARDHKIAKLDKRIAKLEHLAGKDGRGKARKFAEGLNAQ